MDEEIRVVGRRRVVLDLAYAIGETVYFAFGEAPGIVTAVRLFPTGIVYVVTWAADKESAHYAFELSSQPNYQGAAEGA